MFYSQSENVALHAVFRLLNLTNTRGRDSAIEVARRLSALLGTDACVHRSSTERSFWKSGFWVIPKMTPANYSTSISPFEYGKSGKEEEKTQKFENLENGKSFLDEIKTFFTVFEGL